MKLYGYEIPQHVIDGAACFMRREPFTSAMLVGVIDRLLPADAKPANRLASRGDIAYRGADRIVQRERKAGRLVSDSKLRGIQFWRWVDKEAA